MVPGPAQARGPQRIEVFHLHRLTRRRHGAVHAVPEHDGRLVQRVGLGLEVERPGVAPRAAGCVDNVLSTVNVYCRFGEDFLGASHEPGQRFSPGKDPRVLCRFVSVCVGLCRFVYVHIPTRVRARGRVRRAAAARWMV